MFTLHYMVKSFSSKPINFMSEFSFFLQQQIKVWLTGIRLFFIIFKVITSFIILTYVWTSYISKHDVSHKDILSY